MCRLSHPSHYQNFFTLSPTFILLTSDQALVIFLLVFLSESWRTYQPDFEARLYSRSCWIDPNFYHVFIVVPQSILYCDAAEYFLFQFTYFDSYEVTIKLQSSFAVWNLLYPCVEILIFSFSLCTIFPFFSSKDLT